MHCALSPHRPRNEFRRRRLATLRKHRGFEGSAGGKFLAPPPGKRKLVAARIARFDPSHFPVTEIAQ